MVAASKSFGEKGSPFLVIFSDLDGTLLDEQTYSWEEAEQGLNECRRRGVPIVLVTSKTRAELEVISVQLGLDDPYITENGGGVFFPKTKFPTPPPGAESVDSLWRWSLGVSHGTLKSALREIATEVRCNIIGLSDMRPEEIASLTGLDIEQARRAAKREFDEPFLISDADKGQEFRVIKAAEERGLRVSKGGRFFHLHGNSDKGTATKKLITWYRNMGHDVLSLGIGDSENDFPMLQAVDRAVFVGDPRKLGNMGVQLSTLKITTEKGPKGWNEGVMNFLQAQGGIY